MIHILWRRSPISHRG